MRILMLTDDATMIDRRILLEAESLIDLFPHKLATPSMTDFVRIMIRRRDGFKRPWAQRAIGVAGRAISTLKAQRGNTDLYFRTQVMRLTDPWIPRRRRIKIAAKSVAIGSLMVAGGAAIWARRLVRANRHKKATVDFLDAPWQPTIWDTALINRGLYYDPDIVHAHDLPQLFAGAEIARRLKVPLIYDAHEIYSEISSLNEREKKFLRTREARLIHKADAVITVNPIIATWFEKTYNCRPVLSLTNATVRPENFDPGKIHRRYHERLQLPSSAKILAYQGWFSKEGRGIAEIIRALKDVRMDVHFVMIGYGDKPYFQDIAREVGVADRVHLLDAVPWQELLWWSASADVGVIPYQAIDLNHLNCSPNKLFEFISAQLPMLVNDLPYLRLVVEGEGFGIARPMTTVAEMTAAINEMFDPARGHLERTKRNLAENGWRWEWPEECKKLLELYAKLPPPKRPRYGAPDARVRNSARLAPPPSQDAQTNDKPRLGDAA